MVDRLWLEAFVLTLGIEAPIVAYWGRSEPSLSRRLAAALLGNALTHPAVWFAFPALGLSWTATTSLSEGSACLVEAGVYRLLLRGADAASALRLSLVANLASFGTGLALWAAGLR